MWKTHCLNTQQTFGIYLQKTWRLRQIIGQRCGIYISSTSGSENAFEHRGWPTLQQTSGRPILHNFLGTCLNKKMVAATRQNKASHVFHVFQEPVPRIWSILWALDLLGSVWQRKTCRPASKHNFLGCESTRSFWTKSYTGKSKTPQWETLNSNAQTEKMRNTKLNKPCPPQRLLFASHRPVRLSLLTTFRPENERRLRSSSLTVSPAHPPRFLRVCPAQPRKRGPALTILRPRKQSFLERFTRRFPPRALPRWGPHKPSPDRQVALLHGQPRDPTPTSARDVVYRPKPAHRASIAAFCATPPAKAGWLTNPDQPEASKSSQPSQQDTKRHRIWSHDKIAIGGSVELAWQPRQIFQL